MDGSSFVALIEAELKKQKIPKEKFYSESGVSSATMSQWRKNIYSPSSSKIKDIERYLGVTFSIEQKESPTPEGAEPIPGYSKLNDANRGIVDTMIAQLLAAQSSD